MVCIIHEAIFSSSMQFTTQELILKNNKLIKYQSFKSTPIITYTYIMYNK